MGSKTFGPYKINIDCNGENFLKGGESLNCDMDISPHDEHRSSRPRPLKVCLDQNIFQLLYI